MEESKIAVYETFVEDMLKTLQSRLRELEGMKLDAFEQGRQLAYEEMMDIIKTRYQLIWDVLS